VLPTTLSPYTSGPGRPAYQRRVLAKANGALVITFVLSKDVAACIGLKPGGRFCVELEQTRMVLRATHADFGGKATAFGNQVSVNIRGAFLARDVPAEPVELSHQIRDGELIVDLSQLPTTENQRRNA
jgi:hypothetical protein